MARKKKKIGKKRKKGRPRKVGRPKKTKRQKKAKKARKSKVKKEVITEILEELEDYMQEIGRASCRERV